MNPISNNVVAFPKPHRDRPAQSMSEVINRVEESRKEHISYLVDDMVEYVFQRSTMEGFDVADEEHIQHALLFIESLRALLYCSANLYHPLHNIAKDNITYVREEDLEED